MEFRFNINEIFKTPIVEIESNLIPPGFQGDRRQLWEAVTKVSEVINTIGEASASAQGLTKPITTAERLRNAENQRLYLLIDRNSKTGKGSITGMLKTGKKGLYVFDREGQHYQVQPNCVLDFYIHETRQRTGLGKHLFEHMLQKEEVDPVKLAIDRPSDKFLAFLKKHYNLEAAIRQMNNFVVFEGFFPKEEKIMSQQQSANNNTETPTNRMTTTIHLDTRGSNGLQQHAINSSYGRYGAPRPPCSMGQIIHNQSAVIGAQEPSGCSLNMIPKKERSTYTLRRASRHPDEEVIKQFYAAPRHPFHPCAAVGNGLGYSPSSNIITSNVMVQSNIQLVDKHQLPRPSSATQNQVKPERPQSIMQNLPSPIPSCTVNSNNLSAANNLVPNTNNSLIQQNVKEISEVNPSGVVRSPSGLQYYPTNQSPQVQVGPVPVYLRLCDTHSQMVANMAPSLQRIPQNLTAETNDPKIPRPKPIISAPLTEYPNALAKSTVNVNNNNHQPSLNSTYQNCQPNHHMQYIPNQQQNTVNNKGDQQSSANIFYWQNQIYQSRDAPTNYPFVSGQNNPNKFYMSHEECGECFKKQQHAVDKVRHQQMINKQQQATALAQNKDSFDFDQTAKKCRNTEQKVFPIDFKQQNVQKGYYQQQEATVPPSEGPLTNNQLKQQTYQLNSQNINLLKDNQKPLEQQMNPCQSHQQIAQNQQKYNLVPNNFTSSTNANLYQTLPTIAETESEQLISAKEAVQQHEQNEDRKPQQSTSKFNANIPGPINIDVPFNTEQALLQKTPQQSHHENIKLESNQQHQQHFEQPEEDHVLFSPRYNQSYISSAVTSQNIGNFDVQSPRFNQYLAQQQAQILGQEQNVNHIKQKVPDYSVQYDPTVRNQQQENVHLRPLSSHPTTMQNLGNFELQSPRLNLNLTKEHSVEHTCYRPPQKHAISSLGSQQKAESYHQNQSPKASTNELRPDADKTSASSLMSPNSNNRSYSPNRLKHSVNDPIHKNPINHKENNFIPMEGSQSKSSFEHCRGPNDKSEQVKPNCLPERTPRLNSAQASASTQINIPKNIGSVQPISAGYNDLSTGSYRNLQHQEVLSRNVVPLANGIQSNSCQQQRDSPNDHYITPSTKIDRPHPTNSKGDVAVIPSVGQTLPVEMRPEIASQ